MEHVVLCARSAAAPFGTTGPMVPVATRTLAAYLARHLPAGSFRVSVVDFPCTASPAEMLTGIAALEPDVVGLSCYVWNYAERFELCDLLERELPRAAVVLGGPQVAYDADDLARLTARHPGVAAVIQGEGERPLLDYLRTPRADRPRDGAAVRGEPPEDLDSAQEPLLAAYPPAAAVTSVAIETQRGCPFRCAFCSVPQTGTRLRSRGRAGIEREIRWAVEHGIPGVGYANAGLNLDPDHLHAVVAAAVAADPARTLVSSAEVDYRRLTPEQVQQLARLRLRVGVGLQAVGPAANTLMHRRFEPTEFRRAVGWLRAAGMPVTVELILGLPGDSLDDIRATLDLALSLECTVVGFVLRVLPGSEFYRRRRELGLVYDEGDGHRLLSSPWLSPDDLERACAELRARGEAALLAGRAERVRLWGRDSVEVAGLGLDPRAAAELREHCAAFFARFPGLRLAGTELDSWNGVPVLVCRVDLRTGEAFGLGFTRPEEKLEALLTTPSYKVIFQPQGDAPPSRAVRRVLEALQRWAQRPS